MKVPFHFWKHSDETVAKQLQEQHSSRKKQWVKTLSNCLVIQASEHKIPKYGILRY